LNADLSHLKTFDRVFVFTCHSIEQVETLPQSFFDAVAKAGRTVTCVHLEPFGFQISKGSPISQNQEAIFRVRHWNLNLASASQEAERRGVIKRTFLAHNQFSIQPGNPTSLLIWNATSL
jgi:hypothetical protein